MARSIQALPRIYMGTMTFGWGQASSFVDSSVATEMMQRARSVGITHFDSARIYSGGATEPIVGECLANLSLVQDGLIKNGLIKVTTKAHPSQPRGLSPEGLENQLRESLHAMGLKRMDEFYLHQPDTENDLSASLAAAHDLVQRGLVGRIGMSNYHEDEVERAVQLCLENGWTAPTLYQGLYNPLNRRVESGLLPTLRKYGIDFIAYNALAAGLLTGKHKRVADVSSDEVIPGRFKNNPNYLPRFYTDSNFAAIEAIQAALPDGVDTISATYQWLLRHSQLTESDGILLGASSLSQLDCNLAACVHAAEAEPLSQATLDAFDEAWRICSEAGAFPYWRSYSNDHPNRDNLDPGASYSATKKA